MHYSICPTKAGNKNAHSGVADLVIHIANITATATLIHIKPVFIFKFISISPPLFKD